MGGFSGQLALFDAMGRAIKTSNPTETSASGSPLQWVAAGDDAAAGWLYTQQTYDWKGRPLITTNTDMTTKEASYGGCGCAGGQVVTLTDEGTIDGGVAKRRQQKIYADVLGRTLKTELLNWQGGSVYSTTVSSYNARDQLTLARQYQGADTSGIYQETTITYDGFGRLKTRHVPEQDAGTTTTWDYNLDDTVQKITDARSASATYNYNNRHLLTGITYAAPTGITATPNVLFTYDAAGNRTSMTDGLGSVSYNYDQLSRLTSESRIFTGVGTFPLTYTYNLANDVTSVTDPWSTQVVYGHDASRRLTGVTGSGTGSAPVDASNLIYRASGSVKSLSYGNGVQASVSYSPRQQPTNFKLTSPNTLNPTPLDIDYSYTADGMLRNSTDRQDATLDRAYHYDHAGRLAEGFTASEARSWVQTNGSSIGTVVDGPYRQTYTRDTWSNMTTKWARSFTGTHLRQQTVNYTYNQTTNRNTAWYYDAEGNSISNDGVYNSIDAAGQLRQVTNDNGLLGSFEQDGDGQRAKQTSGGMETTYYLHSSMLEQDVAQIASDGTRTNGFVYADGDLIATQASGIVYWQHRDPSNRSVRTTDATGAVIGRNELDPMDITLENPQQPPLYRGGIGGGGREPGGDVQARIASLMDTRFCDFGTMLVPCGLRDKYAQ